MNKYKQNIDFNNSFNQYIVTVFWAYYMLKYRYSLFFFDIIFFTFNKSPNLCLKSLFEKDFHLVNLDS